MTTAADLPPPPHIDFSTILITTIQFTICACGLCMNLTMLLVLYKNKHFRRIYDLLLATTTIYDALNEIGIFVPVFTMATGTTLPLLQCYFVLYIPTFALICTYQVLFFISCHRFWAAILPISYKKMSKWANKVYLCSILLYVQLFSFYVTQLEHQSILDEGLAEKRVYCQTGEPIVGYGYKFSYIFAVIMNVVTGLIYITIFIIMKVRKIVSIGDGGMTMVMDRLNRSLAIIVFSTVSLWSISSSLNTFVFPWLLNGSEMGLLFNRMSIQLMKVSGAINLPIVYSCSLEYRKAINNQFRGIFGAKISGIGQSQQKVAQLHCIELKNMVSNGNGKKQRTMFNTTLTAIRS